MAELAQKAVEADLQVLVTGLPEVSYDAVCFFWASRMDDQAASDLFVRPPDLFFLPRIVPSRPRPDSCPSPQFDSNNTGLLPQSI